MTDLVRVMLPELILTGAACICFLLGVFVKTSARRGAAVVSLLAMVVVFFMQFGLTREPMGSVWTDRWDTLRVFEFAQYIKLLAAGVGILLVLLAWPTTRDGRGQLSVDYGNETAEFFGLMLLSITGVFLVAGANDIMLLFLGIELTSIPTYIMVSVSRPIAPAQEAGVKYFFLGALSAALMLFGFSYLYGTTGTTNLSEISAMFARTITAPDATTGATAVSVSPVMTSWQMLAVLMTLAGFAFKIAAVPLHFYAGDVYQGAATPVTAFLAFVPKTAGMVAIIKLLFVVGGAHFAVSDQIVRLLWILSVLTMTAGNVLGLLQFNVKRVLAYSSVAHSGYMLMGLTALVMARHNQEVQDAALAGVLFYLAAYGIMNVGAFGVLMLLPSRDNQPATSAETFDDLAGMGRRHVVIGLAMAVCCFSLIGLPLTVGFFGKFYLIKPALTIAFSDDAGSRAMLWLVLITVVNAAISAGYYLKIVAAMFLRPEPANYGSEDVVSARTPASGRPTPILAAVGLSVAAVLVFGTIFPATAHLSQRSRQGTSLEAPSSIEPLITAQSPDRGV